MRTNRTRAFVIFGILGMVVTFAALSAGGLIQFSYEMGIARWLAEEVAYAFTNKFAEKLFASVAAGLFCGFVANMIAYGRSIRRAQGAGRGAVRFQAPQESVGSRIA